MTHIIYKVNVILLIFSLSAASYANGLITCQTPGGVRAVEKGQLVDDLTQDEEIALEDEIDQECNEGIEFMEHWQDSDGHKVQVFCGIDSAPNYYPVLDCVE